MIKALHNEHNNRDDPFMLFMGLRDKNNKVLYPNFPTDYDYSTVWSYKKSRYLICTIFKSLFFFSLLYELKAGTYSLEVESYDDDIERRANIGRRWVVRVYGENILFAKT